MLNKRIFVRLANFPVPDPLRRAAWNVTLVKELFLLTV
jgi:hypothetical protein